MVKASANVIPGDSFFHPDRTHLPCPHESVNGVACRQCRRAGRNEKEVCTQREMHTGTSSRFGVAWLSPAAREGRVVWFWEGQGQRFAALRYRQEAICRTCNKQDLRYTGYVLREASDIQFPSPSSAMRSHKEIPLGVKAKISPEEIRFERIPVEVSIQHPSEGATLKTPPEGVSFENALEGVSVKILQGKSVFLRMRFMLNSQAVRQREIAVVFLSRSRKETLKKSSDEV